MLSGWQYLTNEELARIEQGIIENRVFGGPWHIELTPTNHCPVDCFFCFTKPDRHGESLDWPVLKNLLIQNRKNDFRMLHLTGGGDPLAYRHISELVDLCGEQQILLQEITTNGVLLAPLAKRIVDTGLGQISISLNETSADRYSRTMRTTPAKFHDAMEGIREVIRARDQAPEGRRPHVWVQCMLWKESAKHIIEMYDFLRGLGVDTIFFRTIFGERGHEKLDEKDRPMVEDQLREIICRDCESREYRLHFDLGHELDLHLFSRAEQEKYNPPFSDSFPEYRWSNPRNGYCYVGWYTCSINPLGSVYPCTNYHNLPVKETGNIYKQSLDEIWNGERYKTFRDQIHKMVRLKGKVEPSHKYNCFIESKCASHDACICTYRLATHDFYDRVASEIWGRSKPLETFRDYARNAFLRQAHRIRDKVRNSTPQSA